MKILDQTPHRRLTLCLLAALGVSTSSLVMADVSVNPAIAVSAQSAAERSPAIAEGLAVARQALQPGLSNDQQQALSHQALALLERTEGRDDPEALWYVGGLYMQAQSRPETVAAMTRAADRDHAAAAYWMAMYYRGIGDTGVDPVFHHPGTPDERRNANQLQQHYLAVAGLAGHVNAMRELAERSRQSNPALAQFWSQTAAEHQGRIVPVKAAPAWVRNGTSPPQQPAHQAPSSQVAEEIAPDSPVTTATAHGPPSSYKLARDDQHNALLVARIRLAEAERRIAELEAERADVMSRQLALPNSFAYLAAHGALAPLTPDDELNRRALDLYAGRNYVGAAQLFNQAAMYGSVSAQANLGLLYLRGMGVEQDTKKAIDLLRKAARAGNAVASENLGLMYANGLGGKVDFRKARMWFELAISQGSELARTAMIRLNAVADR